MHRSTTIAVAFGLMLSGQAGFAQDLSRYRAFGLEASLDAIVAASGARPADARTLHTRPASIQELEWRPPYVGSGATVADPVRTIVFSFYDDALFQAVVNYDAERTEGMTNGDIVEALSAVYGQPSAARRSGVAPPPGALPGNIVIARWEDAASLLTLVRESYAPEFHLILNSKRLSGLARTAIREAGRLDLLEAPQRRQKDDNDARAVRDKARVTNKAAFRP